MNIRTATDPLDLEVCTDGYGRVHRLDGEISRGGQGVVFRTKTPNIVVKFELQGPDGANHLVPADENAKYMRLRFLPIPKGAHVTMPQATLKEYGGYVMQMMSDMIPFSKAFDELKDCPVPAFVRNAGKEVQDRIANYVESGGERRRLEAFMKSAALLAQLHAQGLVYCDYSLNNVFVSQSKEHCNVWLIDADNLEYESKTTKGLCFTPGLAAPEVFLSYTEDIDNIPEENRVGRGNSFASDVYTFALCLFRQLAGCHPFKGEAFEEKMQDAENPEDEDFLLQSGVLAYIADDNDDCNRGHPFPLEDVLTTELKALFQQTFCQEGRDNCLSRPGMGEWAAALARANDLTIRCPACSMDHVNEERHSCPWCDAQLPVVFTAESFYASQNSSMPPLWRFRRELGEDTNVALPLRLLHGYDAEELDRKLLTLRRENGMSVLNVDTFDTNIEISFSEDGYKYEAYKRFITKEKRFYLRCKDTKRDLEVCVECGVSS